MALLGNLLATLHKYAYVLCRKARNMGNGILLRLAPGGDIAKIRNAGDKTTVALAVDHCPVPDAIHVSSCWLRWKHTGRRFLTLIWKCPPESKCDSLIDSRAGLGLGRFWLL